MHASVIERLRVFLHYAEHHYSISETCRQFGISRSTFHRWMDRFDPENLGSLADKSHEPLTARQSAIDPQVIELVRRYRMRYPQMGKERIAELLLAEHGAEISASSVGRVIERECMYFADTPLHWKKRLEHQKQAVARGIDPAAETATAPETHVEIVPEEETRAGDTVIRIAWPDTRLLRRFLLVSCLVTNIAFVCMLAVSVFLEYLPEPERFPDTNNQQLHAAPLSDFTP